MPAEPALADSLGPHARRRLDTHGYLLLPAAVPAEWIAPLRAAFDAGVLASHQWPVPRGASWRHAQVDLDEHVQRVCRLPALLAGVQHILKAPFFLSQVEGREPLQGNAPQPLHRDAVGAVGQMMAAMLWLDPYGPENGATQVVPGSHRTHGDDHDPAAMVEVLTGAPGDLLIFDPNLLHGATTNHSGARRRSLLLSYDVAALHAEHRKTEHLRGVRMNTDEIFGAAAPLPTLLDTDAR